MKQFRLFTLMLLLAIAPTFVYAQYDSKDYDSYYFVQAQGGLQLPFTPGSRMDLVSPNFGLSVGRWFVPNVGMRLGAEGLGSKVKVGENYNSFNYLNFNYDMMFNLLPFFYKEHSAKTKLYLLGGIGLNVLTEKKNLEDAPLSDFAHNLRVGLGFDYHLSKPLTVSLEYRLNNTANYFNGRKNSSSDWLSSLLLGVSYNFGHKTRVATASEPVLTTTDNASEPTSLYDQMQAGVNDRMNTWMRRLKDESKADYLARTSEEAINAKRLEYTTALSTDLAGDRANTNKKDLLYNSESQLLGIEFTDMPTITLNVPESEISYFRNVDDVHFTNTVYNLNPGDQFEIIYTESINPATGKKYSYVRPAEGKRVDTRGYLPVSAIHQAMESNIRLQETAQQIIQEAKEKNILSDNTTITVTSKLVPTENGRADYHISYKYSVQSEFSAHDDFAPGKYDAESSNASMAMLKIINQSLSGEFAEYLKPGKYVHIHYHGSADAKQIRGRIAYNGKYGDIVNQEVSVNGKQENMTVTRSKGITTNEQLSLLRAMSVSNFVSKNVTKLNDMEVVDSYSVEVSEEDGAQFRRVSVMFIFNDVSL